MNLILFDDDKREHFFPFTETRPVADIRCGILTMRERWELYLNQTRSTTLTQAYLQQAFPLQTATDQLYINARVAANSQLVDTINHLNLDTALLGDNEIIIALRTAKTIKSFDDLKSLLKQASTQRFKGNTDTLDEVWDIFEKNAEWLQQDFKQITTNRASAELPHLVTAVRRENIFIESGAKVAPCIINASDGPVYIGRNATIMDGALIRGPFALGEESTLKMGAKIYGGTTIGPHCKVGGEVNNTVFFNYSNKGHDGFIGNAVIGDWCNLGADTNCSNLKNNYDEIKIWQEHLKKMATTHLQFCGLLMGDHSKCGINTMFNTGTVVGVSCNIFGSGFPPKYIPSFTWGGIEQFNTYNFNKAIDTANRMMARRHKALNPADIAVLKFIFDQTQKSTKTN